MSASTLNVGFRDSRIDLKFDAVSLMRRRFFRFAPVNFKQDTRSAADVSVVVVNCSCTRLQVRFNSNAIVEKVLGRVDMQKKFSVVKNGPRDATRCARFATDPKSSTDICSAVIVLLILISKADVLVSLLFLDDIFASSLFDVVLVVVVVFVVVVERRFRGVLLNVSGNTRRYTPGIVQSRSIISSF